MKCKAIHKKLIFYLDGELPQEEMEQVRQHILTCQLCAAFAGEMEKTMGIIEQEKVTEENPFFYTRIKARLVNEREELDELEKRPVWLKVLQPAFFSVILLFGIYGGFKIAQPQKIHLANNELQEEVIPYLNEMETEPLETFLME